MAEDIQTNPETEESHEYLPTSKSNIHDVDEDKSPRRKYKSIFLQVCLFILCTEFCERLAFYGLTGSLAVFYTKVFGISTVVSTELTALFSCVTYLMPILGAYVADRYIGRFKTILVFCSIYVVGMIACTMAAHPIWVGWTQPVFFIGLYVGVTTGSGGIKPNVVVLGADQFDCSDPKQEKEKDRFFNYFYWAINLGAMISFSVLAFIALHGAPPLIPEDYGFFVSFLIPTISMALAIMVFLIGSPRYNKVPPEGSALARFFRVVYVVGWPTVSGKVVIISTCVMVLGMVITMVGFFVDKNPSAHLAVAITGMLCIFVSAILLIIFSRRVDWMVFDSQRSSLVAGGEKNDSSSLVADETQKDSSYGSNHPENGDSDAPPQSGTGNAITEQDVQDSKDMLRLLPYLSYLVVFWACYGQMTTNFVVQGCQMDLQIFDTQLTPVMLNLFDTVIIIVFIPIFDRGIYPAIAYCRAGRGLSSIEKIGAGFFFCALSMFVAGFVEIARKDSGEFRPPPIGNASKGVVPQCCVLNSTSCSPYCNYNSACAATGKIEYMNKLSIWWQVLQFVLIGISEILASISSYELFYSQVPMNMRSVCQALNLLTTAIGSLVAGGLNSMLSFWIPENLNNGHLEYVFFFIGFLALATLVTYTFTARSFEFKKVPGNTENRTKAISERFPNVKPKPEPRNKTFSERDVSTAASGVS